MHECVTVFGSALYPVGYVEPGADAWIREEMRMYTDVYVLDIRLRARSRWFPAWNKGKLQTTWGESYIHDPRLGNVNYRDHDLPIQLADPVPALRDAVVLLRTGFRLFVVCACKDYEQCHRKTVVELLLQRCQDATRTVGMRFDVDRNLYVGITAAGQHLICVHPGAFDAYRARFSAVDLYHIDTWMMLSYGAEPDQVWVEPIPMMGGIQDASPLV